MKLIAFVVLVTAPLALACSSAPEREERASTESRIESSSRCPEGRAQCRENCGGDLPAICSYFATSTCVARSNCLTDCGSYCPLQFDDEPNREPAQETSSELEAPAQPSPHSEPPAREDGELEEPAE